MTPELFSGVGEWYQDFSQTSDTEVTNLLERARSFTASPSAADAGGSEE
jgi:predicted phosphoribosyltransferase